MVRKIKIYTANGMPGTIETNATNLGGLKPILRERNINFDGMKMLVGETKNELSMDESILPEGDFKLYLMPAKTKSGVDFDVIEDNVKYTANVVRRIESKIDDILAKLSASPNATSYVTPSTSTTSISMEDQREIEELRKLASGSSSEDWD